MHTSKRIKTIQALPQTASPLQWRGPPLRDAWCVCSCPVCTVLLDLEVSSWERTSLLPNCSKQLQTGTTSGARCSHKRSSGSNMSTPQLPEATCDVPGTPASPRPPLPAPSPLGPGPRGRPHLRTARSGGPRTWDCCKTATPGCNRRLVGQMAEERRVCNQVSHRGTRWREAACPLTRGAHGPPGPQRPAEPPPGCEPLPAPEPSPRGHRSGAGPSRFHRGKRQTAGGRCGAPRSSLLSRGSRGRREAPVSAGRPPEGAAAARAGAARASRGSASRPPRAEGSGGPCVFWTPEQHAGERATPPAVGPLLFSSRGASGKTTEFSKQARKVRVLLLDLHRGAPRLPKCCHCSCTRSAQVT